MTAVSTNPPDLAGRCYIGLPGPDLDGPTAELLGAYPPGGVVLFRRNVSPDPTQIKALTRRLQDLSLRRTGREMVIAIDQEGGTVKRLPPPFGQYPAASAYGPAGEAEVYDWGLRQGRELRELGVTMDFAPVLDINTLGQKGVMASRAYGADPETVARLGLAAIRGLQAAGVAACAKHFPGMGQTELDPHEPVRPVAERSLEELLAWELIPFIRAMAEGVEAIMTSHLVYPGLDPGQPASLSRPIISDLLKTRLGFTGLVLTDDLDMGAITLDATPDQAALAALAAGADRVLLCQNLDSYRRLLGLA
jgi:beta-N-acetylhexosaminidase